MVKTLQTDIAIIGGGMSAALLARILHNKTLLKIDIFEASSQMGGNHQAINTAFGSMDYGPKIIPSKPEYEETVKFLGEILGRDLIEGRNSETMKAVEKGELTSFVGFGFRKPEAIEEWDYYVNPERLQLNTPVYALCHELLKGMPVQVHSNSKVTRLEISEDGIASAIVNGETRVEAKAYVLCTNAGNLLNLIPQEKVDAKIRQKLSKAKYWTSISLNLVHRGEVSQIEEPIALLGSGDFPFMGFGFFHTPRQETGKLTQFSQWMTFVAAEQEGEEEEAYAHALRELKKLLQKGFPKILETVESEKIAVSPLSHGRCNLKFEKNESFHGFKNLWHCHPSVADLPNLPGAILRAKAVADELMKTFESASRDLPENTDKPHILSL
jgi:protoporphyrinogen oxidase